LPDITKWNIREDCKVEDFFGNCVSLYISEKIKKKFKIDSYWLFEE
jgi:hypothetical protein